MALAYVNKGTVKTESVLDQIQTVVPVDDEINKSKTLPSIPLNIPDDRN
jgi:hypothetical protein